MLDIHCHLLPGLDDGARDTATALDMARVAVADGIRAVVCTPHNVPGLYDNTTAQIQGSVEDLARALAEHHIPLVLATGCDAHIRRDFVAAIRSGTLATINQSRYVLVEPPHHVAPPRLGEVLLSTSAAGYVPILTHPERLSWIESHYGLMVELATRGIMMQITAGSLTGGFGRRPLYWAERMLDEGHVSLLATDAHDPVRRPPVLSEARRLCADRLGESEAENLVLKRPFGIFKDMAPSELPPKPSGAPPAVEPERGGVIWRRLAGLVSGRRTAKRRAPEAMRSPTRTIR